jgi:hypothetical protein
MVDVDVSRCSARILSRVSLVAASSSVGGCWSAWSRPWPTTIAAVLLTAQPGWAKTVFSAWFLQQQPDALRYFIRQDSRRPLNLWWGPGLSVGDRTPTGHQTA